MLFLRLVSTQAGWRAHHHGIPVVPHQDSQEVGRADEGKRYATKQKVGEFAVEDGGAWKIGAGENAKTWTDERKEDGGKRPKVPGDKKKPGRS